MSSILPDSTALKVRTVTRPKTALSPDIVSLRLKNQLLSGSTITNAGGVVKSMIAMQAQEYAMAKWAIGLRAKGLNNSDVENAFNKGEILRLHVLRPTWHFVSPADIRWLTQISAPKVHVFNAPYYRKGNLDKKTLIKGTDLIVRSLEGGKQLLRSELKEILLKHKMKLDTNPLAYLMMYAELEGIICSGGRRGKQFSYALVDEWVKPAKHLSNEEAMYRLVTGYFRTRCPATVHDFAWWSGFSITESRKAISMLPASYKATEGKYEYIYRALPSNKIKSTFLLPDYDEYGISYKNRSVLTPLDKNYQDKINPYSHFIIVDGKIAGTWKPSPGKNSVFTAPFSKLNRRQEMELKKAVDRYYAFHLS